MPKDSPILTMDAGSSSKRLQSIVLCTLLGLTLIFAACKQGETAGAEGGAGKGGGGGKAGGKKGGDAPVTVAKAASRNVPTELEIIGNVEASSTVLIKPQISGELTRVMFQEGDYVTKGQPLFEIDKRSLEAQLAQANANMARSQALVRQAEANVAKSQATLNYADDQAKRYGQLAKEGVMSKEQAEQARSTAQAQSETVAADKAAIESAKADIAAQKAAIDTLRVQMSFATIKSPITGRTGSLLVKQGNIVSANNTDLVQINQVQPVFVAFSVPELRLRAIQARYGRAAIPVIATPQDREDVAHGTLTFFDNTVDPTTGTIRLRGTFPNPDRKLWPGEFLRVRLQLGSEDNAVVVPNQAVQTGQDGQFIFVVKEDRSVETRPITTGQRTGDDIVIESGLRPGETIVTEGQLRLSAGMKVSIRDPRNPGGGGAAGGKNGRGKKQNPSASGEAGESGGAGAAPAAGDPQQPQQPRQQQDQQQPRQRRGGKQQAQPPTE